MSSGEHDLVYNIQTLTCPPKSQKVSLQPPTSILPTVISHAKNTSD